MGTPGFTWGDCLALVENVAWDDPINRATKPDEWFWDDPMRDVLVSVVDLLMQVNAKTPRPEGMPQSRLPDPVVRPWKKRAKNTQSRPPGRDWDDMAKWLEGRVNKT